MISRNFNRLKTPFNPYTNQFHPKYIEYFNNMNKSNNNLKENENQLNQKKYYAHRPNLYRSFIKSSAPYHNYKYLVNKNSFLGPYNDLSQKEYHPFIAKEDLNQDINDNKKIVNKNLQSPHYQNSNSLPQLSRNISYDNYRYNNLNMNKNWDNTFSRTNYFQNNQNFGNYRGFKTSKSFRLGNDGKIIYTLKKMIENKGNLRYPNKKKDDYKKCRFINSCFSFRPRTKNRFHKTQIFNLCKPFLVDEFQEFPEEK